MKIHEYIEATKEFNKQLDVPYEVRCALGGTGHLAVFGQSVQFTREGDYLEIEQARQVINWLSDQLGGKVTWNKE